MKPLDAETKRLLRDAIENDAPGRGAEARIWQSLSHHLDKPLPPIAAAASKSSGVGIFGSAGSLAGLKLVVGVIVAVAGVGGAVAWPVLNSAPAEQPRVQTLPAPGEAKSEASQQAATDPNPSAHPSARPELSAADWTTRTTESAQPARAANGAQPDQPSAATSAARTLGVSHATASRLQAETRLIAQAQRALSANLPNQALSLLNQHRARFTRGALAPEREAARVFALCAAGRREDAELTRARFLERWPDSPLASHVRASCP